MVKVTLDDGRVLFFPESMTDEQIEAAVSNQNEPKTEFGKFLKKGFWGGVGEIPATIGGAVGLVEDIIPGKQESIEGFEQKLKGYAESLSARGGQEEADTFLEKFATAVGATPGTLLSMAAPVAATAGLGPLAGPAAGFGLYGAMRHGGEGLPQSIGQGLRGAAEGLAFGGMGKVASKVGGKAAREILKEIPDAPKKLDIKQLKDILTRAEAAAEPHQLARRLAHAGGAGGVVTGAGLLSGEELEDALAGGAAMGLLGGAMHKGKFTDPALTRGKKIRDLWEGLKKEQDILTKGSAAEAEVFGKSVGAPQEMEAALKSIDVDPAGSMKGVQDRTQIQKAVEDLTLEIWKLGESGVDWAKAITEENPTRINNIGLKVGVGVTFGRAEHLLKQHKAGKEIDIGLRTSPIQDKYTREFSNPYGELPSARKVIADKFPEREPRIQLDEKYVAEIERDINLDQATHERHTPRQKIDIEQAREYDAEAAVEATANMIGTRTIAGTRARGSDPHNVRINQLTGEVRVRGGHEDAALMELQKLENGLEDYLATNYKEILRAEALGDSAKVAELKIEQKENTALYQALKMETMGIKSMGSNILRTAGQKDLKAKQKNKVDKLLGEVANLSDLTNDIMKWANGDPATFRGLARALKEPTGFDYAYEYWINGLLSGIPTQVTNTVSNAAVQMLSVAERAGKVPIDVVRARMTGTPRQHRMSDLYGDFMGAKIGLKKALYVAGRALKNENYEGEEFYQRRSRDKLDYKGQAFEGLAGTIIRAPSRFLYAMDMFFKTIAAEREGWSEAYRIAGGDHVKAQKIMYEEVPLGKTKQAKQILNMMKKAGEDQTFTTPPDKLSTQLLKMRELDIAGIKPGAIVLPFVNTPWNIIKYAFKRSPLFVGAVAKQMKIYKEKTSQYKKGKIAEEEYMALSRKFNKDMSEFAAGAAISGLFFGLAKAGSLTGGGPADPIEKMNLLSTGWKPYSLHIGGQYISLQRIEPIGTLLGIAADISELGDTAEEDKTGKLLSAIKDNLTNKTFLYGLENISRAWADPERFGSNYAKQMLGTASPALLGKMTQAIDPYSRKTDWNEYVHGVPEAIAGRVPGLSLALEQRSTALGEPSDRWSFGPMVDAPGVLGKAARAASTMVSPIVWDKEKQATVAKEFDRLRDHEGIPPSMPPRKKHLKLAGAGGERIELSNEEYKVYDKYHAMAEDHLEKLISGPGWAAIPDVYKAEQIRKVYKKYRKTANNVINMMIRRRAAAGLK